MIRARGLFHLLFAVITMSLLTACGGGQGEWPTARTGAGLPDQGGMGVAQPQIGAAVNPAGAEGAPVKVGLLLPLTGPQGTIGRAMEQAAQLALFDMGAQNFTLIPRDTGGSPQSAQRAAQEVADEGVQIVLGPLLADSVRAAKSVTAAKNIPMITFSTDWALAGGNTYMMGFVPFIQVSRVVEYAAQSGIQTAAIIAPRDSYGDATTEVFEKEAAARGIAIAARVRFSGNTDPSMTQQIQTLAQNKAIQAVFIPVGGMKADEISSTLSYHGMTPDKVIRLGTGLWDDQNLAARASMQGAVFAAPSPRQYAMFEAKYRSVYGEAPPRLASLAYDATALAAVLARQGGDNPYSQEALMNPNGFAGMDGIFRFNRNALVERGLSILQINNRQMREISPAPSSFQ